LVVIDYDFFVTVVMNTHSQELPLSLQQVDQPNPTIKLVGVDHNVPLSKSRKKIKPNASRKKTTSIVLDHFIRSLEPTDSIARFNHCKQFRCDLKIHGTSNLLNHLKRLCPKSPFVATNDPNKTTLTFKSDDNNSLLATT